MKLVQNTVPSPCAPRPAPMVHRGPSRLVPRRQLPTLPLVESPLQRLVRWIGWR